MEEFVCYILINESDEFSVNRYFMVFFIDKIDVHKSFVFLCDRSLASVKIMLWCLCIGSK